VYLNLQIWDDFRIEKSQEIGETLLGPAHCQSQPTGALNWLRPPVHMRHEPVPRSPRSLHACRQRPPCPVTVDYPPATSTYRLILCRHPSRWRWLGLPPHRASTFSLHLSPPIASTAQRCTGCRYRRVVCALLYPDPVWSPLSSRAATRSCTEEFHQQAVVVVLPAARSCTEEFHQQI
jgi:hypothetical protein